jgi:hypothetical protein
MVSVVCLSRRVVLRDAMTPCSPYATEDESRRKADFQGITKEIAAGLRAKSRESRVPVAGASEMPLAEGANEEKRFLAVFGEMKPWRNPKPEIRTPKEARNPKSENRKANRPLGELSARAAPRHQPPQRPAGPQPVFRAPPFGVRSSDFFRASVFGFRISRQAHSTPNS